MSRVLILSRQFPKYHPKSGEDTFFVEKFLKSVYGFKECLDNPSPFDGQIICWNNDIEY